MSRIGVESECALDGERGLCRRARRSRRRKKRAGPAAGANRCRASDDPGTAELTFRDAH